MEYVLTLLRGRRTGRFGLKRATVAGLCHVKDHFIPHARNNYHPHMLGHRALGLFSASLVAVKIFTLALLYFGPVIPAYSSAITAANIISLTNESRKSYQLSNLTENSVLDRAAQAKADDMLAKGYFAHNSPDNKTPWDFIIGAGYNYLMAGENLAVNFQEAENVEQAWMNSPGHKANILNKNFEEIGIGISQGEFQGHTAIFVVQMFGVPAEQKITISDAPTAVQTQAVPLPPQQIAGTTPVSSHEAMPQEVAIEDGKVQLQGDTVKINTRISDNAVKVIAFFGRQGVLLSPKAGNVWEGQVPLNELTQGELSVRIEASDIKGQKNQVQLADFASGTIDNFHVLGAGITAPAKASIMGKIFDPKIFEQRFYLLFIASISACMVLAIGIKRHIQHLSLIANSSFVVILACLLWMAG